MAGYLEDAERAAEEGFLSGQRRADADRLVREKIIASGGLSPEDTLRALADEQEANPGLIHKGLENLPRLWHHRAPAPTTSTPDPVLRTSQTQPPSASSGAPDAAPAPRAAQPWLPKYERARQNLQSLEGDMTTPGQRKAEAAALAQKNRVQDFENEEAQRYHDQQALAAYRQFLATSARNATVAQKEAYAKQFIKDNHLTGDAARAITAEAYGFKLPTVHPLSFSSQEVADQMAVDSGHATPEQKARFKAEQEVEKRKADIGLPGKTAYARMFGQGRLEEPLSETAAAMEDLEQLRGLVSGLQNRNNNFENALKNTIGRYSGNQNVTNVRAVISSYNGVISRLQGFVSERGLNPLEEISINMSPKQIYGLIQTNEKTLLNLQQSLRHSAQTLGTPQFGTFTPSAPAPRAAHAPAANNDSQILNDAF